MTPVIYDVILRNFNKVVKEKYGDKSVKVSELPWRDWWRECGARPVGQNNVAGHLALRSDMFEKIITYDEFPFLDDTEDVTNLTLAFCSNVEYSALPPVKSVKQIVLFNADDVNMLNVSLLQSLLENTETCDDIRFIADESCKIVGKINLQKFNGCLEAPLKNNEATFIIPNGWVRYFGPYPKYEEDYITIGKQTKVPFVESKNIDILAQLLILDKAMFINHFKAKNLWFDGLYFSDENKTIFNDGNYEKLTFDYTGLNGCDPYEVLISFNGTIDTVSPLLNGKSNFKFPELKKLFKKHSLTYYTPEQVKDAIDSAVNAQKATVLTGGF